MCACACACVGETRMSTLGSLQENKHAKANAVDRRAYLNSWHLMFGQTLTL